VNGDGYCGACLSHRNIMMALAARAAAKAAAKVARMSMHRTTPMAVGTRIAAMTNSSIIFKTFISPTPVLEPTIRPHVHGIPGIVGMILQPRHECTGLQWACNGCNRCRCIPSSSPPLPLSLLTSIRRPSRGYGHWAPADLDEKSSFGDSRCRVATGMSRLC